jgi:23S rRNA (pseudouridine1915-N3)-methyltransferase
MQVVLLAVGRLKNGPERELCGRYAERFMRSGRAVALDLAIREVEESGARRAGDRQAEEARMLAAACPAGAPLIAWDERGKALTSAGFAAELGHRRDAGLRSLAMVIGGADGLSPAIRDSASLVLSFGGLTLPHQLARVLVLEQLYRAGSILAGHPYHRE